MVKIALLHSMVLIFNYGKRLKIMFFIIFSVFSFTIGFYYPIEYIQNIKYIFAIFIANFTLIFNKVFNFMVT